MNCNIKCPASCKKAFPVVIIALALILAILAVTWPQTRLSEIVYVSRFFDVMLPVLAVGALIKYLACCSKSEDK